MELRQQGDALLAAGDVAGAESVYRQALAAASTTGLDRYFRSEVQVCLSRCRLRAGSAQDAVDCATKASLLGQGRPHVEAVALSSRADAHEALGNLQQVESDLRRAAALLQPTQPTESSRLADRAAAVAGRIARPDAAPEAESGRPEFTGCEHYRRKCKMFCPTCDRAVPCRLCHDEIPGIDHNLDRFKVHKIQCQMCMAVQPPSAACTSCGVRFADYYCDVCHLWREFPAGDVPPDFIWHCDRCGLCRIGHGQNGRSAYSHCDRCGSCWPKDTRDHQCLQGGSKRDCPVCLEDLHTSRRAIEISYCGHFMHNNCKQQMLQSGRLTCPLCKKSIIRDHFPHIEMQVAHNPMPPEYRDIRVVVLCNDCVIRAEVPLHWVAMRCPRCRGYNTTQVRSNELTPEELLEARRNGEAQPAGPPPLTDSDGEIGVEMEEVEEEEMEELEEAEDAADEGAGEP